MVAHRAPRIHAAGAMNHARPSKDRRVRHRHDRARKRPAGQPPGRNVPGNDSGAGQRFDASRQSRQLPRDRVRVNDALPRRALHFRLRFTQRAGGHRLVAARDRHFDLLNKGTHAGLSRRIACGTDFGLTDTLTRGCGVRHDLGSVRLCWGRDRRESVGGGRRGFYRGRLPRSSNRKRTDGTWRRVARGSRYPGPRIRPRIFAATDRDPQTDDRRNPKYPNAVNHAIRPGAVSASNGQIGR